MIAASAIAEWTPKFGGTLLSPGHEDYDKARKVFNAMIDRRPGLIARCASAEDVMQAVNFARDQKVQLAVRGAGHNAAGFAVCDAGLVVDLSPMKKITVDAKACTVCAEGGATWGEVNDALQPYGLAATGGFVSITGVSGLTLGGGLGWLVRKHGLAIDNLLSARMVLADGRSVTASDRENADLFWAIRGGGGNFGIVTEFEFQAHPVGTVLAGVIVHPIVAAGATLRRWRDFEKTSPEEFTSGGLLFHFPDDASAPAELRGATVAACGGVYAGPLAEGEKVLAPLRAYGQPIVDLIQPMPYNVAQRMADSLWPSGLHHYWKSSFLEDLSDAAIDVITAFFARVPSTHTVVVLESLGHSAIQSVPESATAFGERHWPYNFLIDSAWTDPKDAARNLAWTREFYDAMSPFRAKAAYVNYIGEDDPAAVKAAYGAEKLVRLTALKRKYDPENLFRLNQNIAPSA
jgi:FAD/FMN-containing dehydrogenase